MPTEARWFVKTGLVYLVLTFVAGSALLVLEATSRPAAYVFAIEHAHVGAVGWLVNLVIGIALWMLPLNRERFPSTQGRYPPRAAFACFGLLNGGFALRVVGEPWYQLGGAPIAASVVLVIAAVAQLIAVLSFVAIAWQRVRGPSLGR